MSDTLAILAEEHTRDALQRAIGDFPQFPIDSWSECCCPGQFVIVEDDEGRRSQAELNHRITRGVQLEPGKVSRQCQSLVKAVLDELRAYVAGGELVVSRPLPEPMAEGVHAAHLEFRGVWLRLTVGHDEKGLVGVLSALLGKAPVALHETEESVVWLGD